MGCTMGHVVCCVVLCPNPLVCEEASLATGRALWRAQSPTVLEEPNKQDSKGCAFVNLIMTEVVYRLWRALPLA